MSTVIETARLRLRPHREDDVADLVTQAGAWDVAAWLKALPHPYTEAHGREWITFVLALHAAGDARTFVIALKGSDRLIGGVGFDGTTGDGADEPALAYWLGTSYRSRGYGREAVAAIIGYGFCKFGLATIRAVTAPDNTALQRLLLACGFSAAGDIDLIEPMRSGARRAPLYRQSRCCSLEQVSVSIQDHIMLCD